MTQYKEIIKELARREYICDKCVEISSYKFSQAPCWWEWEGRRRAKAYSDWLIPCFLANHSAGGMAEGSPGQSVEKLW